MICFLGVETAAYVRLRAAVRILEGAQVNFVEVGAAKEDTIWVDATYEDPISTLGTISPPISKEHTS